MAVGAGLSSATGIRPWRCGKTRDQPTSSSKLGRTFRARKPSEN